MNNHNSLADLMQRVEKLERRVENARKLLQTEQLQLIDGEGRLRAKIEARSDGSTHFAISDPTAQHQITMSISTSGDAAFGIHIARKHRVTIGAGLHRGSSVGINDASGKSRFTIGVNVDDTSGLSVGDRSEEPRVFLTVDADGLPGLRLLDANGRTLFSAP